MKKKQTSSPLSADGPKAPLEELEKWPEACHPHLDCEISGVSYPAPASLDAAEVAWWIDYIDSRLAFSRNMVNGLWPAALAVFFGLIVSTVAGAQIGLTWQTPLASAVVVSIVLWVTKRTLSNSDHRALEQRWLLYRERARDLARAEAKSHMPGPANPAGLSWAGRLLRRILSAPAGERASVHGRRRELSTARAVSPTKA